MGRFSKISQDAFNEFQVDAGVLLKTFDVDSPELVDETSFALPRAASTLYVLPVTAIGAKMLTTVPMA